ncbi:MAG: tryptophan synthase subunit alpha [Nitrospirae bacterium GWD2_57_9]|nr:MAG: tryptophan synthase subunit alpha [Nitrospirae bacterium GWD2_57_9]OGW47834.1 MAG: tryptophan synthase subunit alpha [Nitrospirae bacterium GWC2_57_9]
MSRIKNIFNRLKKKNETALIPYIMAGDPDLATTRTLILEMEKAGCDIIELGAPFSDPLADGPTIQKAALRALQNHTSIAQVLALVVDVRKESKIPLILMTYYNLIFKYGEERFVQDASASGLDGLILPDLPPEEAGNLISLARKAGLDTIFLLAPTSTEERIKTVVKISQGFVYYVSLTGVTGARTGGVQSSVRDSLQKIKAATDKPVAVGFGISTPDQAAQVAGWGADGVIVGSALVKVIEENAGSPELVAKATAFVKALKQGVLAGHGEQQHH